MLIYWIGSEGKGIIKNGFQVIVLSNLVDEQMVVLLIEMRIGRKYVQQMQVGEREKRLQFGYVEFYWFKKYVNGDVQYIF